MDSCKCCKKEEDGMGGGGLIAKHAWLRFFIYTTKKNLPYRTELSVEEGERQCLKLQVRCYMTSVYTR